MPAKLKVCKSLENHRFSMQQKSSIFARFDLQHAKNSVFRGYETAFRKHRKFSIFESFVAVKNQRFFTCSQKLVFVEIKIRSQ